MTIEFYCILLLIIQSQYFDFQRDKIVFKNVLVVIQLHSCSFHNVGFKVLKLFLAVTM